MKRIILFDNNEDYDFLAKEFDSVLYSPSTRFLFINWLIGSFRALSKSNNKDIIVCWYDFQAVILFWLCLLTFRKRNIICLNILLKPKISIKNSIVTWLYKIALSSSCFKATVTSVEYGNLLNSRFKKDFNYELLHDVYHDSYNIHFKGDVIPRTVFCGGRNGRDWDFMMKVACEMPDVHFNLVVPLLIYNIYFPKTPKNVSLKYNLTFDAFLNEMCHSEIVCLPLNTDAPAGLIVLFQAAANSKPIITTKTATTVEYLNVDRGILLDNNVEEWVSVISDAFRKKDSLKMKGLEMKSYLEKNCTEEIFINKINKLTTI